MIWPDQLKRYLEEHAGAGIHYVWIDVSCINVRGLRMETMSDGQMNDRVVLVILSCKARSYGSKCMVHCLVSVVAHVLMLSPYFAGFFGNRVSPKVASPPI